MPNTSTEVPLPTIVFVHGAFADGSIWNRVACKLQEKGMDVTAVQNPLTSLSDDAETTRRALKRLDGPVILVGHSWGGAIITEVGTDEHVVGLIYVAAFAPRKGSSVNRMLASFGEPEVRSDEEFIVLPTSKIRGDVAQDLSPSESALLSATQGPIAARCFDDLVTHQAWLSRRTWYVVTADDRFLAPAFQRQTAAEIGATTSELAASHLVMLSKPNDLAAVVEHAAHSGARMP